MAGHKIKLQSSDGDTFDVEVEIAKQSATIKDNAQKVKQFRFSSLKKMRFQCSLKILGMDDEEDVIPLPNVNSAILKKVNDNKKKFEKIFRNDSKNRLFNGQLIIRMIHHHLKMMKIERRILADISIMGSRFS